MEQAPIITEPAKRHGVSDDDMLHALRNHARTFVQEDGLTMYIGPAADGIQDVEVGVVRWHDVLAIVHAMKPARAKFVR